ncbi:O-antigen ligase family protein [Nitrospirota bacterium]
MITEMESNITDRPSMLIGILTAFLCLFAVSLFFSQSGVSIFGPLSLIILLYFYIPERKIWPSLNTPLYLRLAIGLFVLSYFLSAAISDNTGRAVSEILNLWNIPFAMLLLTFPLDIKHKRIVGRAFLIAACVAGILALMQFFQVVISNHGTRASGFTHPVHYAGLLAVGSIVAMASLAAHTEKLNGKERLLAVAALVLTLLGLLCTQTRGVWISLGAASFVFLVMRFRRKSVYIIVPIALILALLIGISPKLRDRVFVTVENLQHIEQGQTGLGARLVAWKGAYLLFRESPLLGTGVGDWREVYTLMEEGKIPKTYELNLLHAHNNYMQWLATQGLLGLCALLFLLGAFFLWALREIRGGQHVRGYTVLMCTIFVIVWGMTESNLIIHKIFSMLCFTIAYMGSLRELKGQDKA